MTSFRYITVEDWGGEWVRPPVYETPMDPEGFLHHTAGNPMSDRTAEEAFQTLNKFAQTGKGYSFLDYDMLVHYESARDLVTIGEGRGEWLSAATRDRNELGEAVVVLGYFHPGSAHSQAPQWYHVEGAARAFVKLVEWGLLRPDFKLLGHRDNPAHPGVTGCPGDYWYPGPFADLQYKIDIMLIKEPENNDMNNYIRIKGTEDQFLVLPISAETKRRLGDRGATPIVLETKATKAELDAFFGYELTPYYG